MKLFQRNPGGSQDLAFKTKCLAHRILDQVRAGIFHPQHVIEWALKQTGDAL